MKKEQLGLKENWRQFTLLVIINAFVGGMALVPQLRELSNKETEDLMFIFNLKPLIIKTEGM